MCTEKLQHRAELAQHAKKAHKLLEGVGDDDIFSAEGVEINEKGGSKEILLYTNEIPSVSITSTDYGVMSCSFEEYDESGNPIGRLNYYDIALTPEQEFSVELKKNLNTNSENISINTNGERINADEYISVKDDGSIIVSCQTLADDNCEGGSVEGVGYYVRGDAVVLNAIPDENYRFAGWYDGENLLSVNKTYHFTAKEDCNIKAKFYRNDYVFVDVTANEGGKVLGSSQYTKGEEAGIIAIPDDGYTFVGWFNDEKLVSKEKEYVFNVENNISFEARFEKEEAVFINPFTDVPDGQWYTEGILWCYNKGYMAGVSEAEFGRKTNVTRAMFATILAKIDGGEIPEYTAEEMSFSDVSAGKWYSNAIEWAYRNNYASGIGEGQFGRNADVTRETLALFFYTYSSLNNIDVSDGADLSMFTDLGRVHSWALDAVEWAVAKGLISGTTETTLAPRDSASRAEIALIIKNYIENVIP